MPGPSKYPLEPLLEHRERVVEAATAALARAVAEREAAERAEAMAVEARAAAARQAAAVRDEEAARVARGEARAVDFARVQAWEVAEAARMGELERAVGETRARVSASREREARARAELAARKADRDVVAKDEARFVDERRRASLVAEEENAAEAWVGAARGRSTR